MLLLLLLLLLLLVRLTAVVVVVVVVSTMVGPFRGHAPAPLPQTLPATFTPHTCSDARRRNRQRMVSAVPQPPKVCALCRYRCCNGIDVVAP